VSGRGSSTRKLPRLSGKTPTSLLPPALPSACSVATKNSWSRRELGALAALLPPEATSPAMCIAALELEADAPCSFPAPAPTPTPTRSRMPLIAFSARLRVTEPLRWEGDTSHVDRH